MSIRKHITIIHNLPEGGAKELFRSNIDYLRKRFTLDIIHEPQPANNIFSYLFHSIIYLPLYYYRLTRTIHTDAYIAYHSWTTKSPLFFRHAHAPVVYICHEGLREYYDRELQTMMDFRDWVMWLLKIPIMLLDLMNVKKANVIISNSQYSKQRLDKYYGISSKVIYPGLDISIKNQHVSPHQPIAHIVTIGSVNKHKRIAFILNVVLNFKQITKTNVYLHLIYSDYDNAYLKKIKDIAKENKLNLVLHYQVSDSNKLEILSHSDIFLYAPVSEPFGLAFLEAIKCKVRILAYKGGGGYIEVVPPSYRHMLIPTLDIDEWTKKIIAILAATTVQTVSIDFSARAMNEQIANEVQRTLNARN